MSSECPMCIRLETALKCPAVHNYPGYGKMLRESLKRHIKTGHKNIKEEVKTAPPEGSPLTKGLATLDKLMAKRNKPNV